MSRNLLAMGRRFHASVNPPWPFSDEGFLRTIESLRQSGYVEETPGGFIAGLIVDNPLSDGWTVAKEFLWWAEDGSGLRLRNNFRQWAKSNAVSEIQWSCPPDAKARGMFARMAQETEIIYSEYPSCA